MLVVHVGPFVVCCSSQPQPQYASNIFSHFQDVKVRPTQTAKGQT